MKRQGRGLRHPQEIIGKSRFCCLLEKGELMANKLEGLLWVRVATVAGVLIVGVFGCAPIRDKSLNDKSAIKVVQDIYSQSPKLDGSYDTVGGAMNSLVSAFEKTAIEYKDRAERGDMEAKQMLGMIPHTTGFSWEAKPTGKGNWIVEYWMSTDRPYERTSRYFWILNPKLMQIRPLTATSLSLISKAAYRRYASDVKNVDEYLEEPAWPWFQLKETADKKYEMQIPSA
jgi:hypothetical protein